METTQQESGQTQILHVKLGKLMKKKKFVADAGVLATL